MWKSNKTVAFIVFSLILLLERISADDYPDRPTISTFGGDLHISVPNRRNLYFNLAQEGKVFLGTSDLTAFIDTIKSIPSAVSQCSIDSKSALVKSKQLEELIENPKSGIKAQFTSLLNVSSYSRIQVAFVTRSIRRRVNTLNAIVTSLRKKLTTNECNAKSNPCHNGGTCLNLLEDFQCLCPSNWEGNACESDVNECSKYAGTELGCQNGATCVNTRGSYECSCADGWYGLHCTERSQNCTNSAEICGHGTCVPLASGHTCICEQGWKLDEKKKACTVDINECEMYHPPCSLNPPVSCVNLPGTFYCGHCPPGYTGNGFSCTDINECEIFNGGCSLSPMVQCVNVPGSRICGSCPAGYVGNGISCAYQGVCATNNGGCHPRAQCRENPRISETYVDCVCPPGYSGDGYGPNGCREGQNATGACATNPCQHGTCTSIPLKGYICTCGEMYTGRNCDIRKDSCFSSPCENGGTCSSLAFSYKCTCPAGFSGSNCQIRNQCGQVMAAEGSFEYPPFDMLVSPSSQLNCAWRIKTNVDKVINVTFHGVYLPRCTHNFIQIHDGWDSANLLVGRFCENKLKNGTSIISTGDTLFFWFKGDGQAPKPYVNISWTAVRPVCGGSISIESSKTFSSPGAPGNYQPKRDCYWHLQAPLGKRIKFTFYHLDIGNNTNCNKDFLAFNEGLEPRVGKHFFKQCHSGIIEPITSPANEVTVHLHTFESHTGFLIHCTLVEGKAGCGGVYTYSSATISSPKFIVGAPEAIECLYYIKPVFAARMLLHFNYFSGTQNNAQCTPDNADIIVYEGSSVSSVVLGRYCRGITPPDLTLLNSEALIVYRYKTNEENVAFEMEYKTICGGKYISEAGTIKSINYPTSIEVRQFEDCHYTILGPEGSRIQITLDDFNLGSNTECINGYLQYRDMGSLKTSQGTKFCSTFPSEALISKGNEVQLDYVLKTGRIVGFSLHYKILTSEVTGCGGIQTDQFGSIESPKSVEEYENGLNCTWLISGSSDKLIEINWMQFNLESSYQCNYDSVTVIDNGTDPGTVVGKYCGNRLPPVITSSGNVVTITYRVDTTNTLEGFYLTYRQVHIDNVCGGNFFASSGVLRSPMFPQLYPNNRNCKWVLTSSPSTKLMLNVTYFDLENSAECRYDYLTINNGGNEMSPNIGKYCGSKIPKLIYSHTNQLYLHFVSDKTKNFGGFLIYWSTAATGCGGTLNSPMGSITSPHYPEPYARNAECFWKIAISPGSRIQLVIADLELEYHPDCRMDYVEFFDGIDTSRRLVGRFCNMQTGSRVIESTGNHLVVKFHSDVNYQGRGFNLMYSTLCNTNVTGFYGVIANPNFPNSVPYSLECSWEISMPMGNKINLTFSQFQIKTHGDLHEPCTQSYIEIFTENESVYDSSERVSVGKYCHGIPDDLSLNANRAIIVMKSVLFSDPVTFRLEWSRTVCGGILREPEGVITSPNYPNPYPIETICEWHIHTELGMSIEITFEKVEMEMNKECSIDYIKVYNGRDKTFAEIANLCHSYTKPTVITGTGADMFIEFYSDSSRVGQGFKATYRTLNSKCGGLMTASAGTFHSPNYPKNFDKNDSCAWLIQVQENHLIDLVFDSVDLLNACPVSSITIYDGPTEAYPIALRICGGGEKYQITSKSNHFYVELKTHSLITTKGFMAHYTTACGARINTQGSGFIDHFPQTVVGTNMTNCSWTIISEDPSEHIMLTFTNFHSVSCYLEIDALSIYEGEDRNGTLIGSYCNKMPGAIRSKGSALHIELNEWFHNHRFTMKYSVVTTACGGTLHAELGEIGSPNYPETYPPGTQCEWTIIAGIGMQVSLDFSTFELVHSEGCNMDYLEIREKGSKGRLLGSFCGTEAPTNITGTDALWLFFKSEKLQVGSDGATGKGFLLEFTLSKEMTIMDQLQGKLSSPFYPLQYTGDAEYHWTINTPQGYNILFEMEVASWMPSSDEYCYGPVVRIYDDVLYGTEAGEICGRTRFIKTMSNVAVVVFNTFSSYGGSKFLLKWKQIRGSNSSIIDCSERMVHEVDHSEISVSIINQIRSTADLCTWTLTTSMGRHLEIIFRNITLYSFSTYCSTYADVILIYSGNGYGIGRKISLPFTVMRKVCSKFDVNKTISTIGDSAQIEFKEGSVNSNYNRSFSANITDVCGGTLRETNGVIHVDGKTEPRQGSTLRCDWDFRAPFGRIMEFKVILNVTGNINCTRNLIHYTANVNGSISNKFCNSGEEYEFKTVGSVAILKFVGKYEDSVTIRFNAISTTECGGEMMLTKEYNSSTISTPNYPNAPPMYSECIWIITAGQGESLQIDFKERFDLVKSIGCRTDGLEIREGATRKSPLIGLFCTDMPGTQKTLNNALYIRYYTGALNTRNGFTATVSLAYCGGTLRGASGSLTSPAFGLLKQYPVNASCSWEIIVPEGHNMNLTFDVMELPSYTGKDFVEIIEGTNETRTTMGKFTSASRPKFIRSASNKVYVIFKSGPRTMYSRGFKLSFIANEEICGGEISSPSGTITSPNYPQPPQYRRTCEWTIMVPKFQRVKLEFEDFDFGPNSTAATARQGLAVFGLGGFSSSSLLRTGATTPEVVRSSNHYMKVYYWSSGPSIHRGFKARFTSDEPSLCGGDLIGLSGVVRSPNESQYLCQWELKPNMTKSQTLCVNVNAKINGGVKAASCLFANSTVFISNNEFYLSSEYVTEICKSTDKETIAYRTINPKTFIVATQKNLYNAMEFSITYKVNDCGGTVETAAATIGSLAGASRDCAWLFKGVEGEQHRITMTSFNLPDCASSWLRVHNGANRQDPTIGTYCSTNELTTITSQGRYLWLEYHGNNQSSFNLTYEKLSHICGGIMQAPDSLIVSPSYPNSYDNNEDCIWELRSDNGYIINLHFVDRFQLEESLNCENDYVSVYNSPEDASSSVKYCGRNTPPNINSTGTRLFVKFHTNERVTGTGFKATWKWTCGGEYNATMEPQYIESPGYPVKYQNNLRCQYIIRAPRNYVQIQFLDFDIETGLMGSGLCSFDNVTIKPSFFTLLKGLTVCGTTLPKPARVFNSANITFTTNKYVQKRGFKFSYQIDFCGGNVTEPMRIRKESEKHAPGSLFRPIIKCIWNITAPQGQRVNIRFEKVNISYNIYCYSQHVTVSDDKGILANLCGNLPDISLPTLGSNERSLRLEYQYSTYSSIPTYFQAYIDFTYGPESGCGGLVNLTKSTSKTIRFLPPGNNYDCIWHVETTSDYIINIDMHVSVEPPPCSSSTYHQADWLNNCGRLYEIRDGNRSLSDVIVSTRNARRDWHYSTSGATAFIRLADASKNFPETAMTFTRKLSICGHLNLEAGDQMQYITTPNFPLPYPPNLKCEWRLKVKYLQGIQLKFEKFDLNRNEKNVTQCDGLDRLDIVDRTNKPFHLNYDVMMRRKPTIWELNNLDMIYGHQSFCSGTDEGFETTINSNHIQLVFHSNRASQGNGFKIGFKTAGCNRTLTSLSGTLTKIWQKHNCTNYITVPKNYTIALFFNSPKAVLSACVSRSLDVYDGRTAATPALRFCGNQSMRTLFSTGNELVLRAQNTYRYGFYTYSMTYVATDQGRGCGGDLYMSKGAFSSPLYPDKFAQNAVCRWNVKIPMGLKIAVTFKWFDIKGSCLNTYLKITQPDQETTAPTIYCSEDKPSVYIANGGIISVEYKSSVDNTGTGWYLLFLGITSDPEVEKDLLEMSTATPPSMIPSSIQPRAGR